MKVSLKNWLSSIQKWRVVVELLDKPSPATFIIAANAVELGPNGTKEFPVRFNSYMEGTSKAKITFTNPITNEYCFYNLTAKTTMPEILETITIESPIRQSARYILTLENPLSADTKVSMGSIAKPDEWWTCDSKYIRVKELSPFNGNPEGSFEVEYRPLLPSPQPTEHLLSIVSKELGLFKFKIVTKSTPPSLRQILRFSVPLGSVQSETFTFRAFNSNKAEYNLKVSKPDMFTLQKSISVEASSGWDGDDIRLPISFEPISIGEIRDTLTVSSPEGGEYTAELIAECVAPFPKGPFNFTSGSIVNIPFRNFFPSTCTWKFSTDSAAFTAIAPSASVNGKTEGQCQVKFEPKEEHLSVAGGTITAKLFVQCADKPDLSPWVFYLRGDLPKPGDKPVDTGGKKK